MIYSDEEREVGVWRDGKPIYEKTVNIGTLSADNNWHNVVHGVTNIERVISFKGATYHSENGGFWVAYDLYSYRPTTSTGIVISVTAENIEYMNNWVGNHSAYITFQYTKTTDQPGSGTWTTDGTYAKHYSTSEKVIGTWIDGKPIYEKTWDLGSDIDIGTSSWVTLTTISNTGMDLIIDAKTTTANGIVRDVLYAPKVNENYVVAISGRSGTESAHYVTLQYTKTTD